MEGEVKRNKSLSTKLYDISLEGDLPSLLNLLEQDPLILDRCIIEKPVHFSQTPLHIAANLGHLNFCNEILIRKPELAEELDLLKRWSPLHLASSKGHLEIVRVLLRAKPNICFARDLDGRNPIHVAAIEGHVDVLQLLCLENFHAARECANGGETVLHLCVKHNQLKALEMFLELIKDVELLNFKDFNGNTVLHLAVMGKQIEMVKLLLKQPKMAKNAVNNNGLTALDSHIRFLSRTKNTYTWSSRFERVNKDDEIWVSLSKVNALRAKEVVLKIKDKSWVENQSQALMVVASLIATMAFQIVLNPPRGFWQDGNILGPNDNYMGRVGKKYKFHDAGTPIARDLTPKLYNQLVIWNTLALGSSLSVIFMLISGLTYGRRFVEILRITMWISVTATIASYSMSLAAINWHYTTHEPAKSSEQQHHYYASNSTHGFGLG